jgi:hypothetical protein
MPMDYIAKCDKLQALVFVELYNIQVWEEQLILTI